MTFHYNLFLETNDLFSSACAEAVTWVVFERQLPIAQVQVGSILHFKLRISDTKSFENYF